MGQLSQAEGLSIINPNPRTLPGPTLLHELICRSSVKNGPAIDYVDTKGERVAYSYEEFEILSDQLSRRISRELATLETKIPGRRLVIPLMIPQSPQLYIAMVAILKSGAAFCALNLDAPVERIKFILGDISAHLVLATPELKDKISTTDPGLRILTIDDDHATVTVKVKESPSSSNFRTPHGQDLAYVMYTSGSTGTPKGVGVSHLAVTQSLLAHDAHIPEFSRFLQFAAPTFDVSVFEIFFPLFRGSTLICCSRADLLADLPGVLGKMEVDACELTPSVAGSLLRTRENAPHLRLLLTIGEMLTLPVVSEFGGKKEMPSILWGMYGPTEAAIHCTLQTAFGKETSPRCIGVPLETVSAFVIGIQDDEGKEKHFDLVPIGEIGELVVGGHQLADGYLNRPDQTAAAFIDTEYGRVYKTGDKARITADGTIECFGRVAEGQIKLNGQRLELGEIEHAVLRTPGCHSAFVCVLTNVLIAFAAVENVDGMKDRVAKTCKDWLPSFMVPADFIITNSFPRLPSGKIDRVRLKQDYVNLQSDMTEPPIENVDETEKALCEALHDVLAVSIRKSTRLHSVGLDSLSAIQVAAQLKQKNFSVSALDVLAAATVSELLDRIKSRGANRTQAMLSIDQPHEADQPNLFTTLQGNPAHALKADSIERFTEPTALQSAMLAETLKDQRLYVNTMEVQFAQTITHEEVRSWFFQLAHRNEILRSGFIHLGTDLVQVIWKQLSTSQIVTVDEFSQEAFMNIESFLEHPLQVEMKSDTRTARITIHHAVYDGWTFDLILDDLSSLARGGNLPQRPQFSEIASSVSRATSDVGKAASNEFWADFLRGFSGSLLPNFRTTSVPTPQILTASFTLSIRPQVVRTLALESGVSPQAIFQGCISWLWAAINGIEDVSTGTVFSGRTSPVSGIERVMGPCLSTFPIRVNLAESSTVHDVVHSIHTTNRHVMNLASLSLAEIKRAAGMTPNSKLFDILLVYQETLSSRRARARAVSEVSHKDNLETKLLLEIEPRGDNFNCQWTWHSDAYSECQVKTFATHFEALSRTFAQNVTLPIASLRHAFDNLNLSSYTSGLRSVETCSSLAEAVEITAERQPQAMALSFVHSTTAAKGCESITYEQLNKTSNQIARYLMASGVTPGGIVAIIMEKSPALYCGILGILKTGCAYLPLLPTTPANRVRLIFERAQPQLCITDHNIQWKSLPLPCGIINVNVDELKCFGTSNVDVPRDSSQTAYVIFTSGTTGAPKGVAVTNKNMLSNIEVLSRIYPYDQRSRMLQACSQAFDVSVFEIFFAWITGMTLCGATNDTLFNNLEGFIRQHRITHLSMTVTVASLLDPRNVPLVTFLVTSGEPMTDEVLNRWASFLYQGYGPSETTNICTVRKVSPGDSSQYLGWSFENTSSFVLYPNSDSLVPIGCLGELCFGGDQVASGYLNMPELTSSKFFDHPKFGRIYRSGDLGRMLPDRSLIILGRLDSQVKLRGQRIELHEIQSLAMETGVAKACSCVVLNHQNAKSQQLVLFYVPAQEGSHTFEFLPLATSRKDEMRIIGEKLEESLPSYMIPSLVFPISCLPMTSSGKTDGEQLRCSTSALSQETLDQCSLLTQPEDASTEWSDAEKMIADALVAVLRVSRSLVGRWSSFTTLGLDSISAMPLSRKLQEKFHRRIPLSQILQNPSVSRLARSVAESQTQSNKKGRQSDLLPADLAEILQAQLAKQGKNAETLLPCTPLQSAMLASSMTTGDGPAYRNQMLFRLHIAPDDIMAHWDHMRLRHEILRTCFMSTNHILYPFVQAVLPRQPFRWRRLSTTDLDECALRHLDSLPGAVNTLEPPLDLAIISTSTGDNYISFVCHHALYDGMAVSILLSEIEDLAVGQKLLPAPCLKPFLQESLSTSDNTDEFWMEHLDGFQLSCIPQDVSIHANGANGFSSSTPNSFDLTLSSIETRLREIGVSLLSLCQAAWAETLATVSGTPDVCFGNVYNGRSIPVDDVERLVAPCFNTIPIRIRISDVNSNRELMRRCQSLSATMLPFQFTPLRRIQSLMHQLGDTSLFDTLLLLQPPAQSLNKDIWILEQDHGTMDVPVVCEAIPSAENDKLTINIHRNPDSISTAMCNLLSEVFSHALQFCLQYPASHASLEWILPNGLHSHIQAINSLKPRRSTSVGENNASQDALSEPWSEKETQVRTLIGTLAAVPIIGIGKHTSIHRLGLDSISAVQLSNLLRESGINITPAGVLMNPTCAGIVSCSTSLAPGLHNPRPSYDFEAFHQAVTGQLDESTLLSDLELVLPCTPTQQGMISQFILSEGNSYFNFVSWRLDSNLDCQRLKDAWVQLADRHQILRTGFAPVSHPDAAFSMMVYRNPRASAQVKHLTVEQAEAFDVNTWQTKCTVEALSNLTKPPWEVVLLESSGSKSMHLGMHHALYDAFSLQRLLIELFQLFTNVEVGSPVPMKTAISSILEHVSSQDKEAIEFWKNISPGIVVNSFPTMTPLRISSRERNRVTRKSGALLQQLRDSAMTLGVTVQAALQAAWTRVLSSYHGEHTVTFGIVLSGRSANDLEQALIPCITTLPIVAQNHATNRQLLQSMMDFNATLRRYEHVPLTKIQKWIGYTETSIFDTILVYQQGALDADGRFPWKVVSEKATIDYPISIEVEEELTGSLDFSIDFRVDLLPTEQAELLLAQFDASLLHLLKAPDSQAKDLVAGCPELHSILPAKCSELPTRAAFLHQFVEHTAANSPDALALEFVDAIAGDVHSQRWSYQDLDQIGNRVARLLIANGITAGGIVATCFDKCPEAYFTILGVLKAGCAFVALDPSAPASRHEFILHDSQALALMIKEGTSSDLTFNPPCPVLEVSATDLSIYAGDTLDLTQIEPDDTCYCLYTSGTTGTPKGCLITHDNAVQAILAFQGLFAGHWDESSRWLQFASFHFDVSVLEQYWPWSVGIPVISAPRDLILSDLIATISKLEITHIDLTPSLARLVHPDEVPSLCRGVFITGGEQLRQDVLDVWGSKGVIYNAYGPTEATIGVTMYCRVPQNGRATNIGRQFPNVGSYVLQPGLDVPVLRGGIGELCVSGKLVGKGYLNREDLSKERFPLLERFNERVYRTGDLVRVLHDGCFDFLGRADDQVKLRGQRLEIGEVNHAIKSGVPRIMDVATLVTKHQGHDRDVMVSFIVIDSNSDHAHNLEVLGDHESHRLSSEAQDACRAKLPGYMVPTYVLCVPYIPLSANNKAQTGILKQIFNSLSADQLRAIASSSGNGSALLHQVEPKLAEVISNVTNIEIHSISSFSTIFELGVDSITVIELARRLGAAGFLGVAPSMILQHPRLNDLATILKNDMATKDEGEALRINQKISGYYHRYLGMACRALKTTPPEVQYIAPCTPLQEGMLIRSAKSKGRSTYYNSFRFKLSPDASIARLKEAWQSLVDHHPILRTSFLETTESYIQVALKGQQIKWHHTAVEERELEEHIEQRYDSWVRSNDEKLSIALEVDCIQHGGMNLMVVRVFHGIYDARSFDLIIKQLSAAYNQVELPMGPPFIEALPHGPLCDYSHSKPFWTALFSGFTLEPVLKALGTGAGDSQVFTSYSIADLERKRIALGVTQQTIVQAAWLSTLRQHFGIWPSMGIVISGRSLLLQGAENIVGPLFNTIPFRLRHTSIETWTSLLHEIHRFNAKALDFAHVPLRQVQKWCSNGQPLFDNLFTFERDDGPSRDTDNTPWTDVTSTSTADFPLAFEGVVTKHHKLNITIAARRDIADDSLLNSLLETLGRTLAGMESEDELPQPHNIQRPPSKPYTNGIGIRAALSNTQMGDFVWSPKAREIQGEIAALSDIPCDDVTEDTTLLEIGLDSIDAIRLVARLRRIEVNVTTSQLMKQPSIRGIVACSETERSVNGHALPGAERLLSVQDHLRRYLGDNGHELQAIEDVLPPTPLQDSMVAEMVLSDFSRYFNHDVLEISESVDLVALRSAIRLVIKNCPILRTGFVQVDDPALNFAYCQVIFNDVNPFKEKILLEDLKDVGLAIESTRQRALNSGGRLELLQLTPVEVAERQYLVLSIAHALYDGASLDMFHRDVQEAYYRQYGPQKPCHPALARIISSASDDADGFWADYLRDAQPTTLPEDTEHHYGHIPLVHKSEAPSRVSSREIREFCMRRHITAQTLGQACSAAVLATLVKSLNVILGVVISGRDNEDTQDLRFPTMNTVPVRAILHGTAAEYLQYMWENLTNINEFQHFPLRKAQALVNRSGSPLFNALFTMQASTSLNGSDGSDHAIWKSVRSASEVEYPLCIEMELVSGKLIWRLAADERYISMENIQAITDQLDHVLLHLMSDGKAEMLQFTPDGTSVSVCGLPFFALTAKGQHVETESYSSQLKTPAWSSRESKVVDVLAEVSGVERSMILPSQTIYHLGLDSISAIKASSLLRRHGILVSVRDMVKAASIRHIALENNRSEPDEASRQTTTLENPLEDVDITALLAKSGIDSKSVERVLPALPVQVYMLSTWINSRGNLFFNEFSYDLHGKISQETIQASWATLVSELPILRTSFVATGSPEMPFVQIIQSAEYVCSTDNCIVTNNQIQFDSSPFVSLCVSTASEGMNMLTLKIHHALYDGVSLPSITNRLKVLCKPKPPPAGFSCSIWEKFVSDHYGNTTSRKREIFWKAYLDGFASQKHLARNTSDEMSRTAVFRPSVVDITKLKDAVSANGIGLQALFFAAYAKVLVNISQASLDSESQYRDVIFGIYLANRASFDESLQDLPFPTLNIVPLRVRYRDEDTVIQVAKQIQADLLDINSFENASAGLWEIARWTGVKVDSFVNFLSLPEQTLDDEASDIQLRDTTSTVPKDSQDNLIEWRKLAHPGDTWLAENSTADAYIDAVDIEAAAHGQAIDIGVFASPSLLTRAGASTVIEGIAGVLREI
ncbi:uncharacterized protein JN550_007353 [Neoarthrinium moseri]|uniref:uncharacterized protein n=1 Tax=Neoarthrinium moseri TaxID=1658444 RepID=UPI001FDB6D7F|nr:uncharacterized protein JN550_007353 [Neoarthrinium moseri]KAI1866806.1 hypothetical protein JN550_007353 [Neoarthrinium moseri]